MTNPGLIFLVALVVFIVLASLFRYESGQGRRVVLPRFRSVLDTQLTSVTDYLGGKLHYVGRHIIKLSWYYSIHSTLRAILNLLVSTYDRLEAAFMANRERAKIIRAERRALKQAKSHLAVVAEHKVAVELSPKEKKKLRDKSLAGS